MRHRAILIQSFAGSGLDSFLLGFLRFNCNHECWFENLHTGLFGGEHQRKSRD